MHWRDFPWGYILKFTFIITWTFSIVISAVFNIAWLGIVCLGFTAIFMAHLIASNSPDYQEFKYKVKLWREYGGGR